MQTRITRGRVPEPKAKLKVLTVGDPNTQEAISLDDLWETVTAAATDASGFKQMPTLPNARQEAIAQNLAQGMTQDKAAMHSRRL